MLGTLQVEANQDLMKRIRTPIAIEELKASKKEFVLWDIAYSMNSTIKPGSIIPSRFSDLVKLYDLKVIDIALFEIKLKQKSKIKVIENCILFRDDKYKILEKLIWGEDHKLFIRRD